MNQIKNIALSMASAGFVLANLCVCAYPARAQESTSVDPPEQAVLIVDEPAGADGADFAGPDGCCQTMGRKN